MSKNNIEAIYPLSPLQQGLLFHALYDPGSEEYFEQLNCTIEGALDVAAFARSWQQVIDRHPILRTIFMWHGLDEPLQVVRQRVTVPFEQQDWRGLSADEQQRRLAECLAADRRRGFQLSVAPLMRLLLVELDARRYQFVWSSHHLLLDGWSFSLVLQEVFAYYAAHSQGRELALPRSRPYRDYIAWLKKQDMAKAETFWRQALEGFATPTTTGVGGSSAGSSDQKTYLPSDITLSAEATAGLQRLARQHQLTVNTMVQGAWALLLSRYSGEQDVVFGTVVSGRPAGLAGVEQMVGLFINTLPLRVRVAPEQSVIEWLKQLQEQQVEMRQYEYSPLVEVQGWSDVPRGVPLFETLLVFENYPMDKALQEREEELRISNVRFVEQTNYPITVAAMPGTELSLRITYDTGRYESETIQRMLGHFRNLLEGIVAHPQGRLSDLPLLTPAEREQLVGWQRPRAEGEPALPAHELFEAQAERRPEALALSDGRTRLSYGELNARANQVAHYLRALGVGRETRVGVLLERSADLVVALLALFKVGAVYVPLDPTHPRERLAFMLADAEVSLLLTDAATRHLLADAAVSHLCLDEIESALAAQPTANLGRQATPEGLAYLIYTSGSSGQPKAVAVEHQQLAHTLTASQEQFRLAHTDRLPCLSSFSFDISLWELLLPLTAGACVRLLSREQVLDVAQLAAAVREATLLHAVPSLMQHLVAHMRAQGGCADLRQVFVGGEAVAPELLRQMREVFPNAQLHVLYGPTEAAIICSSHAVPASGPAERQMLGRALPGVRLSIRDGAGQVTPVGVGGELWIGGAGVTRGYLGRPELTAEKYVEAEGGRWYRSGDRARWLAGGEVEFLGRADEQVKVRGYRVEVGEVEAVLRSHGAVAQAVVMVRAEPAGEQRLVAYVVAAEGAAPTVGELRAHLQARLPEYMIPAAFVFLPELPLTSNGKVDKRALPAPDSARPELAEAYIAPRTEVERIIASVWQEVLKLKEVGLHDNFFDLGGNSLLAIQVHDKLKGQLGRDFPMVELFKQPTVSALAKYVGREEDGSKSSFQTIYARAEKQRAANDRQRQLAGSRG